MYNFTGLKTYAVFNAQGRELMRGVFLNAAHVREAQDSAQSSEGFFMANHVPGLERLGRIAIRVESV